MTKLRILLPAEQELYDAAAYYESHAPGLGQEFLKKIESAFREIQLSPTRWSIHADGIRRRPLHRFPFSILYRIGSNSVVIVAVMHQRRNPDYWADRL